MGRAPAPADVASGDLLAVRAALAAGASPAEAVVVTGAPVLRPVRAALDAGTSLGAVACDGAVADGAPVAAALLRALAVAEVVGAPAGPAVDAVLDAVAARARLDGVVRTRSAQALLSARVLVALPVAGALLIGVVSPSARGVLLSPLGGAAVVAALVLIAVAAVWIRAMVRAVPRAAGAVDPLVGAPPGGGAAAGLGLAALGVVTALAAGPVAGLLAGGAAGLAVTAARRRRAASGRPPELPDGAPADGAALPTVEALELLALALAAGTGLAAACRTAAAVLPPPAGPALEATASRLDAGFPPAEAFGDALSDAAALIDIAHRWGAPSAQPLRILSADLRARAAVAAEEAAERLTVRLVLPTTALLVPAFGLLVVLPSAAAALGGIRLGP